MNTNAEKQNQTFWQKWNSIDLVFRIMGGMLLGVILALIMPQATYIGILGNLFVNALKSAAPILVLFLVISAIATLKAGKKTNIGKIIYLYLIGTFAAALIAVAASFLFPIQLTLIVNTSEITAPKDISEVLKTVLLNIIDNPVSALVTSNYIGILTWGALLGVGLKHASDSTKSMLTNIADTLTLIVKWVISFAPFGILGIVYSTVAQGGFEALQSYGSILVVLVTCMLFVALVINPIIGAILIKRNPYPLLFRCLKQSGVTAFFMRSSAANIPVNMNLCRELNLNKDVYSVSIPLGATINMAGAAITISTMTMAAVNSVGASVDFGTALLLSLLAALSACGASGVPGGSLLLIPLAASLFGISDDIAMQVVAVGFVIGVVQDSVETAVNSSSDVFYTAIAETSDRMKEGKESTLPV